MRPKVAIIYLAYNSGIYFADVFCALANLDYPKDRIAFVIVENLHPEKGLSAAVFIEAEKSKYMPVDLPEIILLPQKENLGFAGGNNIGMQWAIDNGFDYVFLHNDDGFMDSNCIQPLVNAMENDKTIGLAQSLLLLYPDKDRVNAAGNSYHYLGFGFCNEYRTLVAELNLPKITDISYASGAAVILRADLLKQYGLWDKDFFLYHEDMEYALRMRVAGYRAALVLDSKFFHKYKFSKSIQKFYWMERNRFAVLIMFFKIPTLLLLSPMLILVEVGLWIFAFRGGWWRERLRVYQYWAEPNNWKIWIQKRARIQSMRKISDRMIMKFASSCIYFQDSSVENPILRHIGNPVMLVYYWVVVKGIIWW